MRLARVRRGSFRSQPREEGASAQSRAAERPKPGRGATVARTGRPAERPIRGVPGSRPGRRKAPRVRASREAKRPVAASGCNQHLYSPPARVHVLETAKRLERGRAAVQGEIGGHGTTFGPSLVAGAVRARHGLEDVELSAEASTLLIEPGADAVESKDRRVFAGRVGAKLGGRYLAFDAARGWGSKPASDAARGRAAGGSAAGGSTTSAYPRPGSRREEDARSVSRDHERPHQWLPSVAPEPERPPLPGTIPHQHLLPVLEDPATEAHLELASCVPLQRDRPFFEPFRRRGACGLPSLERGPGLRDRRPLPRRTEAEALRDQALREVPGLHVVARRGPEGGPRPDHLLPASGAGITRPVGLPLVHERKLHRPPAGKAGPAIVSCDPGGLHTTADCTRGRPSAAASEDVLFGDPASVIEPPGGSSGTSWSTARSAWRPEPPHSFR